MPTVVFAVLKNTGQRSEEPVNLNFCAFLSSIMPYGIMLRWNEKGFGHKVPLGLRGEAGPVHCAGADGAGSEDIQEVSALRG